MGIIHSILILGVASVIGIVNDRTKPTEYYYEDGVVTVYKKYQCPKNCGINHFHYVYYDSVLVGEYNMYIDKNKLGEKLKDDELEEV